MGHRNKVYTPHPAAMPTPAGRSYERSAKAFEKEITSFLTATYEMVSDPECDDALAWSDAGDTFVVHSPDKFARNVLGKYFKHSNFQSYVRQLNMYNFHKVKSRHRWEFFHNYFVRGHPELLTSIKRKSTRKYVPSPEKRAAAAAERKRRRSASRSRRSESAAVPEPLPAPAAAAGPSQPQLAPMAVARPSMQAFPVPAAPNPAMSVPIGVPPSPRGLKRRRRQSAAFGPVTMPSSTGPVPRPVGKPPSPSTISVNPLPVPMREARAVPTRSSAARSRDAPHSRELTPSQLSLQSRSAKAALNVRKLSSAEIDDLTVKVRSRYPEEYAAQVVNEIVTRRNVKQLDLLDRFYTKDKLANSRGSSPMPSMTPRPVKRRKTLKAPSSPLPPPSRKDLPSASKRPPMLRVPNFRNSAASSEASAPSRSRHAAATRIASSLYPLLATASEGTFFGQLPSSLSCNDLASVGFDDLAVPVLPSPAPTVLPSPSGLPMQTFVDSVVMEPMP